MLEVDPLSGMSRQSYLEDAQRKYDADNVATFFRSWSGKGEGSAQQIKASNQNELAKRVALRREKPRVCAPQKRTYTQADIAVYDDVRKGKYKGRGRGQIWNVTSLPHRRRSLNPMYMC